MLSEVIDDIRAKAGKAGATDEGKDPKEAKARQPKQKTREEIEAYRERKMREEEAFYLGKDKAKSPKSPKSPKSEKPVKVKGKEEDPPSGAKAKTKTKTKTDAKPIKVEKVPVAEIMKLKKPVQPETGTMPVPSYRQRGIRVGYLFRMIEQEAEALGNAVRMGDAQVLYCVKHRLDRLFADLEKDMWQ